MATELVLGGLVVAQLVGKRPRVLVFYRTTQGMAKVSINLPGSYAVTKGGVS